MPEPTNPSLFQIKRYKELAQNLTSPNNYISAAYFFALAGINILAIMLGDAIRGNPIRTDNDTLRFNAASGGFGMLISIPLVPLACFLGAALCEGEKSALRKLPEYYVMIGITASATLGNWAHTANHEPPAGVNVAELIKAAAIGHSIIMSSIVSLNLLRAFCAYCLATPKETAQSNREPTGGRELVEMPHDPAHDEIPPNISA